MASKKLKCCLAIAPMILGICAIISVVFYFSLRVQEDTFMDGCDSSECRRALFDVKIFMDKSVDPCQDFYKYACGGYQLDRSNRLQSSNKNRTNLFAELDKAKIYNYGKLLEYGVDSNSSLAEQAAAVLYKSCRNKQLKEIDELPEDKEMKRKINFIFPNISLFFEKYDVISSSCSEITAAYFPEAILRLVAKDEAPEERKAVLDFVQQLNHTFINRVKNFSWIDPKSLGIIIERLNKLTISLNYEANYLNDTRADDKIFQNYLSNFNPNTYSFNMMALSYQPRELKKLDLILSKAFPYTIIYPGFNDSRLQIDEILIPYSFWKPPFFSFSYPDVINYARFGSSISRELVHALQWVINIPTLEPEIVYANKYEAPTFYTQMFYNDTAKCVAKQFENINITSHSGKRLEINGSLTSDENVADVLGFQLAFKAFQENGNFKPLHGLDNFSKKQIFFIGAAQSFCEAYKNPEVEEFHLEDQLKTKVYSPMFASVRGLANSEDFGKAFNCPKGSVYNPEEKCVF